MRLSRILVFVICSVMLLLEANAQVVITNNNVVHANVSKSDLRAIFLMRRTAWENGDPIVVFTLETNNPIHKAFCQDTLGLFPYQLRQVWDRLVFSGTGQAPHFVNNLKVMQQKVAETPGAIGYSEMEVVDENVQRIHVHK